MVYRTQPKVEAGASAPRTLVYEALDRATTSSSAVMLFKLVSMPALVAVILAVVVNGTASVLGGVAAFAFALWSSRSNRERATLTIDGGKLTVARSRSKHVEAIPLAEVRNVELDIKKIRRVQEGSSLVPGVRFINTTVGPEIDTARIVIVLGTRRVLLSESYLAHIDTVEWLGKIRVFLRASGWAPADEQAPEEEEKEEDNGEDEDAAYPLLGAGSCSRRIINIVSSPGALRFRHEWSDEPPPSPSRSSSDCVYRDHRCMWWGASERSEAS